jgi:O-antigen ligase
VIRRPGLQAPVITPRLAAALGVAVVVEALLAVMVADGQRRLVLGLGVVVLATLVSVIEPRAAVCGSLFYLLQVVTDTHGLTVADLLLALPLIIVVCSALTGGEIAARAAAIIRAHRYKLAIAVFVVLVVVAVGKGYATVGHKGPNESLRLALAPLIGLGLAVFRDRRDLLRGLRIVFYAFVIEQFLYGLYNLATGHSATAASVVSTGGFRTVANSAAMFLGMAFVLLAFQLGREERALQRVALALLMLMATFDILLSLARSTWIALAIVLPILAVAVPVARRGMVRFLITVAPLIVLGALLAPVLLPHQVSYVKDRLQRPSGVEQDQSAAFRQQAWSLMLDRWDSSKVFGRGFGQSVTFRTNARVDATVTNDPHNGFIYLLVAMGAVGLAAFLAIQIGFLRAAVRALRMKGAFEVAVWCLAAWVLYVANAFTGVLLGQESLMLFLWFLLAIPVALAALPERASGGAQEAPA